MASSLSYTFDLSSEKKVLTFQGPFKEEYVLFHELSWTIYGNSILNITVECNTANSVLIIAELHSHNVNTVQSASLLENCRANLSFQNVNFLTADPWYCVVHAIPHQQLRVLQEPTTSFTHEALIKKGAIKKGKLDQLSADMQHILNTGNLSDVVISDGISKINAHKVILAARSPVFAKMFQHPMRENHENCVVISDISDDVLKELISYIYTGTVNLKDSKMARNLYVAADKYAVVDLRELCSEVLQNISCDNVLDTLALADLYGDKTLKQSALNFISHNYSQVKNSPNWEPFMKENQSLSIEILSFVIDNKV